MFTMGAVPIVVYAASARGVDGLSVAVNGQPVAVPALKSVSADGSSRLVRADVSWQPPGPGPYVVEASAQGATATTTFCILTCGKATPTQPLPAATAATDLPVVTLPPDLPTFTPPPTPTYFAAPTEVIPTATPLPTPTPYPTAFPTSTPYTPSNAEFWADPPEIESGECTVLHWNVYGDFQQVYFEGQPVEPSGSMEECPAESHTYYLQVLEMDGGYTDYWAEVTVYEAPPADTTGPTIYRVDRVWEGCDVYGQASLEDPSGVAWAVFYYNLNDAGWQSISMSDLGGGFWQADAPFSVDEGGESPMGTFQYYVVTADTLGNESTSEVYQEDYLGCGGGG